MSRKLDLSSVPLLFFSIKEGIFHRLKEARTSIRFKQSEIAEIGQVSRATQVSYETDITEPNTGYLRRIQRTGIDIPYILFGVHAEELYPSIVSNKNIDWELLQQAFEDVEFFCVKHAPSCPSSYRWKLVARLYESLLTAKLSSSEEKFDKVDLIQKMWDE
jgi:transcriptional regulator with XRE-family HTH domain